MRVSRVAGREHLISPELQADRIRAFARMRGWTVEMCEPELDVSGGRVQRPVLERVIGRIERGELDGVIVSQIDRLSRMEMTTALTVIERIEAAGGQVVAVAENVDPTTPEGRMARNVFLSMAAMERERHATQLAAAKERAVRLGIWPTSRVPFGYSKGEDRRLHPNRDARRVRRGFEARAAGASWKEVGRILNPEVGPSTIAKIIQNRVYLGEITVGEWHNPASHEPIVSRSLFESAQLEKPTTKRGTDSGVLLRGLVRCGYCQRTMSPTPVSYRCHGRAGCEFRPRIRVDLVDPIAERLFLAEAERLRLSGSEPDDSLADLERAEAELQAFQSATEAAGDVEMFADGLRQRAEAVRQARSKVTARRSVVPNVDVGGVWPELTIDERRHLLGGLIGVVWIWSGDRFRFIRAGFEPDDLSGPGRRGPALASVDDVHLPGELRVPGAEDGD